MAKMEQMEETKVFTEAVTEKAGDVARGAKNLVTDPVDTASGAVSGVGKLLGRASEAVTGGARSDAEESRAKDLIGFSKTKRDYAYELGVDVYSRNPKLQEALDDIAWTGYAGSISTSVAFAAVPGAAGAVISVSGTTALLNKVFRDRAPADLRKMNREKLQGMGVDANVIDLFIRNPVFTPREQTLLVAALDQMKKTEDRDEFIKFAVLTDNPDVALFRQRQAQMYAAFDRNVATIKRFVPIGEISVGQSEDGQVIANVPLDYLAWTAAMANLVNSIDENVQAEDTVTKKQLWLTGAASPRAKEELKKLGWEVHEHK